MKEMNVRWRRLSLLTLVAVLLFHRYTEEEEEERWSPSLCPASPVAPHAAAIGRQYDQRVHHMSKAPPMRDCDLTDSSPAVNRGSVEVYASVLLAVRRSDTAPLFAIDLGCGCGQKLLLLVTTYPRFRGVGLDGSGGVVAIANARNDQINRVRYCVADALSFSGTADMVMEHTAAIKMSRDSCRATRDALLLLHPTKPSGLFRGHVDEMTPGEYMRCVLGDKNVSGAWDALPVNFTSTPWYARGQLAFAFLSESAFSKTPISARPNALASPPYFAYVVSNAILISELPSLELWHGYV